MAALRKEFTEFEQATMAKASDILLLHDGNGVKSVRKDVLLSEVQALMQIANGTYEGVDLTVKFADEIANFSDEWAWVQDRLDNNNVGDLNVSDYIPVTVMGESHKAQIAGINTYKDTGDEGYIVKTHIDWITEDCLSTTVQWNTSNNNNGNASQASPFLASNVHSWLVGTVYPTLEAKVKSVIKDKRLLAPTRYAAGSTLTDDNSWAWTNFDKLWLPLEGEIFDQTVWSTRTYGNGHAVQYQIFANSYKARIKRKGPGGERAGWWEASAHSGNAAYACNVSGTGHANNGGASGAICAPVCFRTMAA